MALFVVLALKNTDALIETSINEKFPSESYKIEDGKWIINADSITAKQLSDKLGITDKPVSPTSVQALVFAVGGYFGRAQPDLWEWMAAKTIKANA
jgi:hypothetical protein